MKFLRWVAARFSGRRREAESSGNVGWLIREAHAHLESGAYDKARVLLLQAIASGDDSRNPATTRYILLGLASTWLLTEQYEDGIAFFSEYTDRHPKDSAAYCGRAAALWYMGRLQDAIRDYSRALELKPDDILSLSGRGQVLAEVGEYARAMEDLDLALRALKDGSKPDPSWTTWYQENEAFVHNGRGVAFAGLGEHGPAIEEFELSITLSPQNAWVYHNRAQFYDLADNREKASTDYHRALTEQRPALSPIRRKHAQARLRELQNSL
jgi:tetratricopeptide (TPR) repeat protein